MYAFPCVTTPTILGHPISQARSRWSPGAEGLAHGKEKHTAVEERATVCKGCRLRLQLVDMFFPQPAAQPGIHREETYTDTHWNRPVQIHRHTNIQTHIDTATLMSTQTHTHTHRDTEADTQILRHTNTRRYTHALPVSHLAGFKRNPQSFDFCNYHTHPFFSQKTYLKIYLNGNIHFKQEYKILSSHPS